MLARSRTLPVLDMLFVYVFPCVVQISVGVLSPTGVGSAVNWSAPTGLEWTFVYLEVIEWEATTCAVVQLVSA